VSRLLQKLGHEMVVANPKQVKLITERDEKTIDWTLKPWHDWRELILSCCGRLSTAARRHKVLPSETATMRSTDIYLTTKPLWTVGNSVILAKRGLASSSMFRRLPNCQPKALDFG
jgi:hypothetical protein